MDLEAGVSLGQLLLAIGVVVATGGIAWGGLMQRVKTLEKEVESLSGFAVALATMQLEISHIKSGIEQITGSWLFREPPGYISANPNEPPGRRRT
jgi:hypothetical protein